MTRCIVSYVAGIWLRSKWAAGPAVAGREEGASAVADVTDPAAAPGTYVFPKDFRPKYGHFDMIFPTDVEVVRKGESKSREVHAFPADRYLLRCAESAASRVQLSDVKGEQRSVYVGGDAMSGPVFPDNRDFREFAFRTWHVQLHEMEGTAVAQVGYVNRVPVLIIRGISDLAGGQRGPNWEETYTRLASKNAASVAAATLDTIIGR
jgi:adenosylhomocysteine nucleosidase